MAIVKKWSDLKRRHGERIREVRDRKCPDFYITTATAKAHITMEVQVFQKTTFSSVYEKNMIPVSKEMCNMILSYINKKTNGQPLEMLVDVGCGTGRYSSALAPHFKKVLGIDMSESQINVAQQNTLVNNVSYMVASAEKIPVKNDSVDLVHAGLAAHWFTVDKFLNESVRVLKTNGCLALHCFYPATEIEYKDLSRDLSAVMSEVWDTLLQHIQKSIMQHLLRQYQSIYEAIPLKDKELITDIPLTIQMSISEIIGFIQSICMYEVFMEKDVKKAEQFLIQTEKRFREILGEEADSVRLNVIIKYYCAFACKH